MTTKKMPCPSCQTHLITDRKEMNSVMRVPVCSTCMDNFHSDVPDQRDLNFTIDLLANELHDQINRNRI
jgi:hypothetical protein